MTNRLHKFLLFVQTHATFVQLTRAIEEGHPMISRLRDWGRGAAGILEGAMRDVRDEHLAQVAPDDDHGLKIAADEYVAYIASSGDGAKRLTPSGWLAKVVQDSLKQLG